MHLNIPTQLLASCRPDMLLVEARAMRLIPTTNLALPNALWIAVGNVPARRRRESLPRNFPLNQTVQIGEVSLFGGLH